MYIYGCSKARCRQNNNMLSASVIINDCSALCNRTQPTYAVGAFDCARTSYLCNHFLKNQRFSFKGDIVSFARHIAKTNPLFWLSVSWAHVYPMDSVCAIPNYNMNFQSLTSRKTRKPNWKWKWASVGKWENRQQPSFTLWTLLSNDRVTLTKLTKQTHHDTTQQ